MVSGRPGPVGPTTSRVGEAQADLVAAGPPGAARAAVGRGHLAALDLARCGAVRADFGGGDRVRRFRLPPGRTPERAGARAALAFAAYVLGSLSVFVFSGPLRGVIRTSPSARGSGLDGLSSGGREALEQVARDSRQRLEEILSLSGLGVDDAFRLTDRPTREPDGKIAPGLRRSRRRRPPGAAMLSASYVPESPSTGRSGSWRR